MRPTSIMSLTATLLLTSIVAANSATAETKRPLAIAIHGGAGVIAREQLGPDDGASYRAGLAEALDAGYAVLERGGSSLDAVTTAVRILEDNPLFNAGRGAVLTHDGHAELDASIMTGHDLKAGAVAGVKRIRHPIDLARKVMEDSPHVMLYGAGAEEFGEFAGGGAALEIHLEEALLRMEPAEGAGDIGAVANELAVGGLVLEHKA